MQTMAAPNPYPDNSCPSSMHYLVVVWEHLARDQDELTLIPGNIVEVIEPSNEEWWVGKCQDAIGLFPVEFCRPADAEEIKMYNIDFSIDGLNNMPAASTDTSLYLTASTDSRPPSEKNSDLGLESLSQELDELEFCELGTAKIDSLESLNELFVKPRKSRRRLPSLTLPPSNGLDHVFDPESDFESGSSMLSLAESSVLKDELSSLNISYAQFNQLYLGDDDPESLFEDSHILSNPPISPLLEGLDLARTSHESSSPSCHSQVGLDLGPLISHSGTIRASEPLSPDEVHEVSKCLLDVQLEGALSIKSDRCESGVLTTTKHWKQFWVVVQAGALIVYKDHKSKKFKGWYDLMSASVTVAEKGQSKKKFVFSLSTSTGLPPALFQAADATSFDNWLTQLKAAIDAHPPDRPRDPMVLSLPRQTFPPKPRKTKIIGKLFSRPTIDLRVDESVWGTLAGDSDNVAYVVKRCVEELVTRGCFKQEGLYRLSGNAASIKVWKDKFSTLGPVSLSTEPDNNVITGVLKLYFRELNEPLIPYSAYYAILEAARISDYDDRLIQMKDILHEMLCEKSLSTLQFLVNHLAVVSKFSDINKMDANNLAIVFGPTLARPQDPQQHPQLQPFYMLVESLITQRDWFFELDHDSS